MVNCPNCGMRLPDWAHFCERCGARVDVAPADPIERVEPEETMVEPIWDEDRNQVEDASVVDAQTMPFAMDDELSSEEASEALAGQTMPYREDADAAQTMPYRGEQFAYDETDNELPADDADNMTRPYDVLFDDEDDEAAEMQDDLEEPAAADDASDTDEEEADGAASEQGDLDDEEAEDAAADQDDLDEEQAEPEFEEDQVEEPMVDSFMSAFDTIEVSDDGVGPMMPYTSGRMRSRNNRESKRRGITTMLTAALVAAVAIAVGLGASRAIIHFVTQPASDEAETEDTSVVRKVVSTRTANTVILTLDGWWKTDRTYDGRAWHFEGGHMTVYSADAKVAKEADLDPDSVERSSSGPGDIEGEGYYLRDVAFYLCDGKPDILYAIGQDGSPDPEANLRRTDAPDYVAEDGSIKSKEQMEAEAAAAKEKKEKEEHNNYILPESDQRVYERWELENMSNHDLFFARYEIYARHGYQFYGYDDITNELADYFNSRTWYKPAEYFDQGAITGIEWQNWSNIQSVEQARGSEYGWRYV